jgi:hypothetical protein
LLALLAAGPAGAQALDRDDQPCLETVLSGVTWRGTSQLYCLKPDPSRTRRDAFGHCQERRFEVTLKNKCEFAIDVRWRFDTVMTPQYRTLAPNQSFTADCGQLSDRCGGSVIATAEKADD